MLEERNTAQHALRRAEGSANKSHEAGRWPVEVGQCEGPWLLNDRGSLNGILHLRSGKSPAAGNI